MTIQVFSLKPPRLRAIEWTGLNFTEVRDFLGEEMVTLNPETQTLTVVSIRDPQAVVAVGDFVAREGEEGPAGMVTHFTASEMASMFEEVV